MVSLPYRQILGSVRYLVSCTRPNHLSYSTDITTPQSTSRMVFTFAGAPISWRTKRQSSIAFSSIEAEYIVATLTAKEDLWIKTINH